MASDSRRCPCLKGLATAFFINIGTRIVAADLYTDGNTGPDSSTNAPLLDKGSPGCECLSGEYPSPVIQEGPPHHFLEHGITLSSMQLTEKSLRCILAKDHTTGKFFCYPAEYGFHHCAPHDKYLMPFCADVGGEPLNSLSRFCVEPWCLVNSSRCDKDMHQLDVLFQLPDDMFFASTETCGGSGDHWKRSESLRYLLRRVQSSVSLVVLLLLTIFYITLRGGLGGTDCHCDRRWYARVCRHPCKNLQKIERPPSTTHGWHRSQTMVNRVRNSLIRLQLPEWCVGIDLITDDLRSIKYLVVALAWYCLQVHFLTTLTCENYQRLYLNTGLGVESLLLSSIGGCDDLSLSDPFLAKDHCESTVVVLGDLMCRSTFVIATPWQLIVYLLATFPAFMILITWANNRFVHSPIFRVSAALLWSQGFGHACALLSITTYDIWTDVVILKLTPQDVCARLGVLLVQSCLLVFCTFRGMNETVKKLWFGKSMTASQKHAAEHEHRLRLMFTMRDPHERRGFHKLFKSFHHANHVKQGILSPISTDCASEKVDSQSNHNLAKITVGDSAAPRSVALSNPSDDVGDGAALPGTTACGSDVSPKGADGFDIPPQPSKSMFSVQSTATGCKPGEQDSFSTHQRYAACPSVFFHSLVDKLEGDIPERALRIQACVAVCEVLREANIKHRVKESSPTSSHPSALATHSLTHSYSFLGLDFKLHQPAKSTDTMGFHVDANHGNGANGRAEKRVKPMHSALIGTLKLLSLFCVLIAGASTIANGFYIYNALDRGADIVEESKVFNDRFQNMSVLLCDELAGCASNRLSCALIHGQKVAHYNAQEHMRIASENFTQLVLESRFDSNKAANLQQNIWNNAQGLANEFGASTFTMMLESCSCNGTYTGPELSDIEPLPGIDPITNAALNRVEERNEAAVALKQVIQHFEVLVAAQRMLCDPRIQSSTTKMSKVLSDLVIFLHETSYAVIVACCAGLVVGTSLGLRDTLALPQLFQQSLQHARVGGFATDPKLKAIKPSLGITTPTNLLGQVVACTLAGYIIRACVFGMPIVVLALMFRFTPQNMLITMAESTWQLVSFVLFKCVCDQVVERVLAKDGIVTNHVLLSWFYGIFCMSGILCGFVSGMMRAVCAFAFGLSRITHLHEPIMNAEVYFTLGWGKRKITQSMATFDFAYMSWWSFIYLKHVHGNPVWVTFTQNLRSNRKGTSGQAGVSQTSCDSESASSVSPASYDNEDSKLGFPGQAGRGVERFRRCVHRGVFISSNPTVLLRRIEKAGHLFADSESEEHTHRHMPDATETPQGDMKPGCEVPLDGTSKLDEDDGRLLQGATPEVLVTLTNVIEHNQILKDCEEKAALAGNPDNVDEQVVSPTHDPRSATPDLLFPSLSQRERVPEGHDEGVHVHQQAATCGAWRCLDQNPNGHDASADVAVPRPLSNFSSCVEIGKPKEPSFNRV